MRIVLTNRLSILNSFVEYILKVELFLRVENVYTNDARLLIPVMHSKYFHHEQYVIYNATTCTNAL